MSFTIKNKTGTERQFHDALKRLRTIPPRGEVTVPADLMPIGVVRLFDRDAGHTITAHSEEAANKLVVSREPVSRAQGGIYGRGMDSPAEVYARERGAILNVVDNFTPRQPLSKPHPEGRDAAGHVGVSVEPQKAGLDAAPPPEVMLDPANEAAQKVFIQEQQKAGLDAAPPPPEDALAAARAAEQFSLTANELLLDGEKGLDIKELRRRAKELLAESYPPGNLSREDMLSAVRRLIKKGG